MKRDKKYRTKYCANWVSGDLLWRWVEEGAVQEVPISLALHFTIEFELTVLAVRSIRVGTSIRCRECLGDRQLGGVYKTTESAPIRLLPLVNPIRKSNSSRVQCQRAGGRGSIYIKSVLLTLFFSLSLSLFSSYLVTRVPFELVLISDLYAIAMRRTATCAQ